MSAGLARSGAHCRGEGLAAERRPLPRRCRRTPPRRMPAAACGAGAGGGAGASVAQLLDEAYGAPPPGRFDRDDALSAEDVAAMRVRSNQGAKAYVYGEVTAEGAAQMASECGIGAADVLYDLGSGHGRLVLQAHLDWGVAGAVGVELSRDRHLKGVRALERLRADGRLDPARHVELINDNLLNVPCGDASVVYFACTMWDADFVATVLAKLDADCAGRGLRLLLSTEDLEARFGVALPPWMRRERALATPMTWADDARLYVYACDRTLA